MDDKGRPTDNIVIERCVRTINSRYFNTLKSSGIWSAFSGSETYDKLYTYSGFDIRSWINLNVNWVEDLESNDLTQYLTW